MTVSDAVDRVDFGIVAAMEMELAPLLAVARNVQRTWAGGLAFHRFELGCSLVTAVAGGMGRTLAGRAAIALAAGHRPRRMLVVGLAGGLDPALKTGDVVTGDCVIFEGSPAIELEASRELSIGSRGSIATVDRPVRTVEEKAALFEATGAAVVEMETYAVAAACQSLGIPCEAIRVVGDDARTVLPREIDGLTRTTGWRQAGFALGALFARPTLAKDLWFVHNQAAQAAEKLAEAIHQRLR